MNRPENLERDLTAWFIDTATPRVPDFTDDILRLTAGSRQRPRWSFPERWLPMSVITLGRQTFKPLPWRTIGLLAVLALLLAAVAVFVGSQPRVPPPFGLAANGLVAYAQDGDIYTVDPVTGSRAPIVTGPDIDWEPRWSLDGTRIAFLRGDFSRSELAIVDVRTREVIATHERLYRADSDSVTWSPDGRSVTVAAGPDNSRDLLIVDASTAKVTKAPIDFVQEPSWRPPDGRQLLFMGGTGTDINVSIVNLADNVVTVIARPPTPDGVIRPLGWTPDGRRVLYMRGDGAGRLFTHVVELTTGHEVKIEAAFGHVSNDGSRMVALDATQRMCVADLDGGPCRVIAPAHQSFEIGHGAGAQWSPDDQWIIVRLASGATALLVDPDTGEILKHDQSPWIAEGAESWQRKAP